MTRSTPQTPAASALERFLFQPVSTATLAIVRIGWGVLVLAWTVSLLPDTLALYGRQGPVPESPTRAFRYGLFDVVNSEAVAVIVVGLLLLSSICVILGYHSRLATVVAFVMLLSLWERNPWHFNGGDMLIRHIGFFLMFAPTGAALSLDRWRRARDGLFDFPQRAPWALRMVQVQISILYFFTTWAKARGDRWVDGTAVGDTMRVDDLTRFDFPYWMTEYLVVNNLMTYGTLVVELALAILIWNRRWRPWVIGAGVFLHLFIEMTFSLGFFASAIFVGYLSFIPEDTAERWIDRVRHRIGRSRVARRPQPSAVPASRPDAASAARPRVPVDHAVMRDR